MGGTFDFRVTPNPNFMLDVNLDEEFDNNDKYLIIIICRHKLDFQNFIQDSWFRSQHNDPSAHHDTALRVSSAIQTPRVLIGMNHKPILLPLKKT